MSDLPSSPTLANMSDFSTLYDPKHITLINDDARLATHCEHIMQTSQWVGLDTEFMRVRTYFPQLCLVQLMTKTQVLLIDILMLKDLSPLAQILANHRIIKIIHSAQQDLEALFHTLQSPIHNLFDTQIAASYVALGEKNKMISYQNIVHILCNKILEKDQTRTDWAKRPLTQEQMKYASEDVLYLPVLYTHLQAQIVLAQQQADFEREMQHLCDEKRYKIDFDKVWRKVKNYRHLKGKHLQLLKQLAAVREQVAITKNIPKRWVISDEALIAISKKYTEYPEQINILQLPQLSKIPACISVALIEQINAFNQAIKNSNIT